MKCTSPRQAVFDVDEGALLAGSIYTSFEA